MKLREIEDGGKFSIFARMNDESKDKMIQSVKYIKQMSIVTEVDISEWDINEIFGTKGNAILVDKKEINKRFSEFFKKRTLDKATTATSSEEQVMINKVAADISVGSVKILADRITQYKKEIDRLRGNYNSYYESANSCLKEAFVKSREMDALSKNDIDFQAHFKNIMESGFWKFLTYANNLLTFATANDVVMRYRDPRHNINIILNLGKFKAFYDIRDGRVRVNSYENNIVIGDIIHPHVSGGNVCWGNASGAVFNMSKEMNISGVMHLLANLLSDYNHDNPYQSLYNMLNQKIYQEASKLTGDARKKHVLESSVQPEDKIRLFERLGIPVDQELKNSVNSKLLPRTAPVINTTLPQLPHDEDDENYDDEDEDEDDF